MDPFTMLLAGSALGGGGSSQRTTQTQNVASANNTAISNPIAFNPVLSAISGQGSGVAPSTSGTASGGLSMSPTTTANPNLSASESSGGGSGFGFLPRSSPTGYGVGPGAGFINQPRPIMGGIQGSDTLLLIVIGVAVFWFATQDGG